jgi:DNA-binding GntR family transcriptional regulator
MCATRDGEQRGLGPARRRGLANEVAERIQEAIFAGVYAPGVRLRELELAKALDVSRGPVREALLRLEREGLVRNEWHRGATVTTLSPRDAAELHSLRGALEQLAVQYVVEQADDEDLSALEKVVERMVYADDAYTMVRLDIEFHDAVYAAAGHQRLESAWQAIRSQVYLFLLMRIGISDEGYAEHIPQEHRTLARGLRAGDADAALELFAEHRRHAFVLLVREEGKEAEK